MKNSVLQSGLGVRNEVAVPRFTDRGSSRANAFQMVFHVLAVKILVLCLTIHIFRFFIALELKEADGQMRLEVRSKGVEPDGTAKFVFRDCRHFPLQKIKTHEVVVKAKIIGWGAWRFHAVPDSPVAGSWCYGVVPLLPPWNKGTF